MFRAQDLTKLGFKRDSDEDFRDDGNNFKGYTFLDLKVTYLRDGDNIYLSFRTDSKIPYFCYQENSTWMKLADKYNGCKIQDIDEETLVSDAKAVNAAYHEIKDSVPSADLEALAEEAQKEYELAKKYILKVRDAFDVFDESYSKYDLNDITNCVKGLRSSIKHVITDIEKCMDTKDTKNSNMLYYMNYLNTRHYIVLSTDEDHNYNSSYVEEINRILKSKKVK